MEDRQEALNTIKDAQHVLVIQGENPDGDSVASALALESILGDAGKEVTLFCAVDIPRHLRYLEGWDRIERELPRQFDCVIIVDTAAEALLERTFTDQTTPILRSRPTIVLDHHDVENTIPYATISIVDTNAASSGHVIHNLLSDDYEISLSAKRLMTVSILYDTRGLSTEAVDASTIRKVADFVEAGVSLSELDEARMAMNQRDLDIAHFKGELLQRIEVDESLGLATVIITWEEIEKYSDRYNPSVLVLDEMRLITGVDIAIAFKTYPDGKILAKIRSNRNAPIASRMAEHFDGGGHPHAAGFKLRGAQIDQVITDVKTFISDNREG